MKYEIEDFSSIFCFGHSTISSTEEGDLCYEISNCKDFAYDQIFDSVQVLGLMHQEYFFETVSEIFRKKEILASKERFMSFVLSRCMKLSEIPTLFNFLVLCTFIDNLISCICNEVECFKVVKMASKCVTAAFRRRYVDLFDKENGFKGFANYCEKLNATVLNPSGHDSETDSEDSLDLEEFIPPDTDEVINLLRSFKEIDDSDFLLTDSEKKFLYEQDALALDIDPAEDVFIPLNESTETTEVKNLGMASSESTELKDIEMAMQNLNIESKKILERINNYCLMCEDNYKEVVCVAKELELCEF
ncbi:hypothetical protein HNY73_014337 [Argiope bruennichi]|uniref:Uncharacterized protein n=1 Tax=Argiope bruennichi TaxID=94029 RepID=A0A8T0ENX5_ARGBR|nr:hypothetical protein HNY73_014337 [Argiope bruennichi]